MRINIYIYKYKYLIFLCNSRLAGLWWGKTIKIHFSAVCGFVPEGEMMTPKTLILFNQHLKKNT
jgi:hypothetical protein